MQAGSEEPRSSLADRTSRGAAWMTVQTILTKVLSLGSQLILARLLLEEDFGLYGLALTVYSFAAMIHQAGIQEVLIHRQRKFRLWVNSAFWLTMATGLVACGLTAMLAPSVARFYRVEDPSELIALIRVLSLIFPIAAAGAICRARLRIEMRFRQLAMLEGAQAVLDVVLKVTLASLGFGAFSFAYGMLGMSLFYLFGSWLLAPVAIRWSPQLRRWKYLLGDGMTVVAAALLYWLIEEGDYIVLGRFEDTKTVGLYFFAFKISRHTMTLLTFQASRVLFPALSSLTPGSTQQLQAFVRAARLIALLAMPACFLLAAVADPLVRLLFEPRWYPAVRLMQIMCLGMALRTLSWPSASLLQAQGRFRTRMWLAVASVLIFFPATIIGTRLGSAVGLATAVALVYCLFAVADLLAALWPGGQAMRDVRRVLVPPITANLLSVVPAALVGHLMAVNAPPGPLLWIAQIAAILAIAVTLYLFTIRRLSPQTYRDLYQQTVPLLPARTHRYLRWLQPADHGSAPQSH